MLQALKTEETLRDNVVSMAPTARVEKLRLGYLDTQDKVVIDILRIRTRVMQETEGEPTVTRQAKAFAAIVREMPINIYPDEPLVGWLFCEPRGSNLSAGQARSLESELDTLSTREITPFQISEEDKRELREEILPYWKAHRGYSATLPHWTAGYEKVLQKGLLGVKQDAEDRLAGLDLTDPEDFKKLAFLEGVVMAVEAAAEIGARFAERARELAGEEADAGRKAELEKIAAACDRVPAHPARTFYEAVQSVWFIHILHGPGQ